MSEVDLFNAIYDDDLEALKRCSKKYGVNIDHNQETPLIYAVMMEKERLVDWLLGQGADMYARNIFEDTAFHLAAKKGYLEMVKMFCEYGVDMDMVGQEGFTALNYAVKFGFDEVAEFLIKQGASLNVPDDVFKETPLDLIRKRNKTNLLALARVARTNDKLTGG